MRPNNILAKMRNGQRAYGFSMNFSSAAVIELLGQAGFDYVWLDSEHGPFTPESIDDLCRAADLAGLTPIARVPDFSAPTILRYLDRGIMGIYGPHVSTGEQAQSLADACRFPPRGKRSYGYGLRGVPPASHAEFIAQSDEEMLVIAMVEDLEGIENLSDILSVDGIDLFTVGTFDLSIAMGYPGQPDHPAVQEKKAQVEKRVHDAGRRLVSDVMTLTIATNLILDNAREFLRKNKGS